MTTVKRLVLSLKDSQEGGFTATVLSRGKLDIWHLQASIVGSVPLLFLHFTATPMPRKIFLTQDIIVLVQHVIRTQPEDDFVGGKIER